MIIDSISLSLKSMEQLLLGYNVTHIVGIFK